MSKPTEKWKLEGFKLFFSKRCALKKLDFSTLETSKNHVIRNFLQNGRLRVKLIIAAKILPKDEKKLHFMRALFQNIFDKKSLGIRKITASRRRRLRRACYLFRIWKKCDFVKTRFCAELQPLWNISRLTRGLSLAQKMCKSNAPVIFSFLLQWQQIMKTM